MKLLLLACIVLPIASANAQDEPPVQLIKQSSGTDASFRGIAVVDAKTAWVTGSKGTVIRTTDGGKSWNKIAIPDSAKLDFRDVEVLPDGSILLMSIGNGSDSRIFRSNNKGKSWKVVLENKEEKGFFDGIAFFDDGKTGLLIGDPLGGRLDLYRTQDGGQNWQHVPMDQRPKLKDGEYGFAASGTGVTTFGKHAWIGTGGSAARVFQSHDRGRTWKAFDTPMTSGNQSSGIFSVAFANPKNGVVIGGDYLKPETDLGNVAITADGGLTWKRIQSKGGMLHKACVLPIGKVSFLTVGRTGVAISPNSGAGWTAVTTDRYYTADFDPKSGIGWMAGPAGAVARFKVK